MPNPALAQAGLNVAQDLVGTGMGLLLEGHNDRRQINQQRRLQALQIQGQKQMGDYNYAKELQFWKDTNFQAQMEQLKMAGLNPALMYKQGGSGGMTIGTPASGGVQGASAPTGGMEVMNMLAQKAQIELIRAQTDKTKAEAGAIPTTVQKTEAEISSLLQGIESAKSQQALTNIQTELQKIEKSYQEDTLKDREAIINLSLSKLLEEVRIIENDREISDQTKTDKVKQIVETAKNIVQDGLYKQAQTAKTWREKDQIDSQIRAIEQQVTINSIDEKMAKEGVNPKAGTAFKTGYSLLNILRNLLGL